MKLEVKDGVLEIKSLIALTEIIQKHSNYIKKNKIDKIIAERRRCLLNSDMDGFGDCLSKIDEIENSLNPF